MQFANLEQMDYRNLALAEMHHHLDDFVAEHTGEERRDTQKALRAAGGATVGRLLGTVSKTMIAATVWVVLCIDAFWP